LANTAKLLADNPTLMRLRELEVLWRRYDRDRRWFSQLGNLAVANTELPVFRCASSIVEFPGDTDYGGMMGSILTSNSWINATNNGVMAEIRLRSDHPITMAKITDGTSQTICVAESADRMADEGGRWISGYSSFSHDNGAVNPENGGEIFSQHRTGAQVGFADGSLLEIHEEGQQVYGNKANKFKLLFGDFTRGSK
jgi:hypothetical protein